VEAKGNVVNIQHKAAAKYSGADKSLARNTFRYILFHGENISFDASLVIHIHK
jgi:hypothetical protein